MKIRKGKYLFKEKCTRNRKGIVFYIGNQINGNKRRLS